MNRNTLVITTLSIIGMIVFLAAAYFFTSGGGQDTTEYPDLKIVKNTDHAKWSKQNKTVFMEYSDFQCPACGQYYALMKNLGNDADGKKIIENITFVYRHFPLDSTHPNARVAAHAAEAAAMQGKFYEMHDLLFEKQGEWSNSENPVDIFATYAKSLKLNVSEFKKDIDSKSVKDKVQSDLLSGRDVNIQGTPTFFLNGKKINNPASLEELKKLLLEGIK